jgi:photosystem II stability/assembly factor-like uncharacterized protein
MAAPSLLVVSLIQTVVAWQPQASGVTARLRGVSAASERVVWASGSNNTILRSTDGGTSWTVLPPPSPTRLDYRDIDAVSDTVAYVLSIGNGPASQIFKTTDAGATWTIQFKNEDANAFYDAMAFSDADHGVVMSDSVDGKFVILMTSDGGQLWTRVPADWLPSAQPNEGAFAASGTNVAVRGDRIWIGTGAAARARVLRSFDRGKSWQVSETPVASGASAGIYSIAFRDDLHGVVVGGDYSRESAAVDNVAFTTNGGVTWMVGRGLGGFRSVVAPVPGTPATWVAVGPLGSDVSTDDGATWRPVAGPGFDTLSFAPGLPIGWGAGAGGAVGRVTVK